MTNRLTKPHLHKLYNMSHTRCCQAHIRDTAEYLFMLNCVQCCINCYLIHSELPASFSERHFAWRGPQTDLLQRQCYHIHWRRSLVRRGYLLHGMSDAFEVETSSYVDVSCRYSCSDRAERSSLYVRTYGHYQWQGATQTSTLAEWGAQHNHRVSPKTVSHLNILMNSVTIGYHLKQ